MIYTVPAQSSEHPAAAAAAAAKSLQSCPTVWPHRRQPTRLPRPWDSPGSLQQWKRQPLTQAGKGNDDSLREIPSRPSENYSRKNDHVGLALRRLREEKARDGTKIEVKSLWRRKVQQSRGSKVKDTGIYSKGKKLRTEVLSVLVALSAEDLICINYKHTVL